MSRIPPSGGSGSDDPENENQEGSQNETQPDESDQLPPWKPYEDVHPNTQDQFNDIIDEFGLDRNGNINCEGGDGGPTWCFDDSGNWGATDDYPCC